MMSHIVPGQLMHNGDAALIKYYPSSLSSPVISILSLALAFCISESCFISFTEGSPSLIFAFVLQLFSLSRGTA